MHLPAPSSEHIALTMEPAWVTSVLEDHLEVRWLSGCSVPCLDSFVKTNVMYCGSGDPVPGTYLR